MKKMKKVFAALLAVMMCAAMFVGCGSKSKAPYEATVAKVFICGDTYNGDMLVVNLDVTNNSKEYITGYDVTYSTSVSIDGVGLATAYMSSSNPNTISNEQQIAPDTTGQAQVAFSLPAGTEEGEISIVNVTYSIDYKSKVTVVDEKVDLATVERVQSVSEYALTIDKKTVTDDSDGKPLLVVDMTFENNSSEATSFGSAIEIDAFQDGIELQKGYLSYRHPLADDSIDNNSYTDIQPGKSIKVRSVVELNDAKKDVEFAAIDRYSFDGGKLIDETIKLADEDNFIAESDYQLDVEGVLIGYDDSYDEFVVVMVAEFTNNSDEEISFASALDIDARQAGMEMKSTYVPGAYQNNSNSISPGTTITVAKAWSLNDGDADVSLTITDSWSYNHMEIYSETFTIEELVDNTMSFVGADEYTDTKIKEDSLDTL